MNQCDISAVHTQCDTLNRSKFSVVLFWFFHSCRRFLFWNLTNWVTRTTNRKMNLQIIIFIAVISVDRSWQHSTQRPSSDDDDSNPFLDMATTFLQETIANQNGGGNGLGGIASLIGSMMQPDAGKSDGGGIGAAQIISGIGSLMANSGGNNGGFDPSIISNVLEMFTSSDSDANGRQKRSNDAQNGGVGIETIINIASAFINTNKEQGRGSNDAQDGLMSLLPMVVQAYNSFTGPEGDEIHAKHKEHAWVLPPFLEKIHVIWDHFSNSELAEALWKKSGVHSIFKVNIAPVFQRVPDGCTCTMR